MCTHSTFLLRDFTALTKVSPSRNVGIYMYILVYRFAVIIRNLIKMSIVKFFTSYDDELEQILYRW